MAISMPIQSLGKYQLLEQVGQGGMASVFKAIDPATNSYWAMKVLNPMMAQDPQFGKRFEREAEVVMRLQHPHIVPVVDYGQANGYAYLVMPLLQVGSLADRLRDGPLTPLEGGRVVRELAGALEFAHSQGVVHRDVKPSNVLMDDQGNALLSDFGLARIHDASVSLTGSALLGTPAYMSPEQARGEKVGPASDQYSMGVILYQLCTGHLPFEAETPMAVMLKHI
ncbi:MAG: serine/threonine-protein kinase, partial [Chloroflexota bacterium]